MYDSNALYICYSPIMPETTKAVHDQSILFATNICRYLFISLKIWKNLRKEALEITGQVWPPIKTNQASFSYIIIRKKPIIP